MPSPLKKIKRGRKKVLGYKRKGAKKGITIKGVRYQLYSKKIDRQRKSHARKAGLSHWHVGDLHGLRSKSRI